jgi:hypothetical protein
MPSKIRADVTKHVQTPERWCGPRRQVLHAAGTEREANVAYAGLHQVMRPVLPRCADLPPRQRRALLSTFRATEESLATDPLLLRIACLTLLSEVSEHAPLLIVVDDAHLGDTNSIDVLAFLARRLERWLRSGQLTEKTHPDPRLTIATGTGFRRA